ncbi:MAG: trigger factor [Lachnospiraceae bacterium]|nr:trigger factor [Lachnospiraceae bacterium]
MRKICIALIVTILAVCAMTACGSKNSTNSTVSGTPAPTGSGVVPTNLYHPCGGSVTLGQYKGLTYTSEDITITDEDIQKQIKMILEDYPNYERNPERDNTAVQSGDALNIDYSGKIDGVAFSGGTANDQFLVIGSNKFIPGFESSLIGATVGTTVDINVTFPEDYGSADLNGKAAVFTVTINYVGKKLDDVDDAYVKRYYSTIASDAAGFKQYIRNYLEEGAKDEQEELIWDQLLGKAIENSTFTDIQQSDIDYYYDLAMAQLRQYAEYYGMDEATFFSTFSGDTMTYQEYTDKCRAQAEQSVKEYMLLQAIVKSENIVLSEDDYTKAAQEIATSVNAASVAELEEKYGKDYLQYCILNDKALEILKSNAIEEKKE